MEIRKATIDDLALVSAVEAECFPPAEAATRDSFKERLTYYGNHFWLLFEKGKLISFADGMVTNLADLTDEMYEKADMHDEHGAWQIIFGLNTVPACRKKVTRDWYSAALSMMRKRKDGEVLSSPARKN